MARKFISGIFAAASALWMGGMAVASPDPGARPNILFILADDLGIGDLGCYGQKRIATPHIDRLAADGIRFSDFYCGTSVCAPSRCVLMTGLHTGHCYLRGNSKVSLRTSDRVVAEMLKQAGYATGVFGKWGLAQEGTDGVPTRKGFDEFFGYLDNHHAHNYFPAFLYSDGNRMRLDNLVPGKGPYGGGMATKRVQYSPDLVLERSLAFIDRNSDRPFFLYFPSTLPHANNEGRPNGSEIPDYGIYRDRNWPDAEKGFAAMVTRLDADVGRLLEKLAERGLERRTIVAFTSDNGAQNEGGHSHAFFGSNGPFKGIKRSPYEGGLRAPMIVRWPGHAPPGTVSNYVGYSGDFFATAAEVAGVRCPSGLDSLSFYPTISGDAAHQQKHPFLYWELYEKGSWQAVRMGEWKGVIHPLGANRAELYDLRTDAGERTDVAGRHPAIVGRILASARQAHVPSAIWPVPDPNARPPRQKKKS